MVFGILHPTAITKTLKTKTGNRKLAAMNGVPFIAPMEARFHRETGNPSVRLEVLKMLNSMGGIATIRRRDGWVDWWFPAMSLFVLVYEIIHAANLA